MSADANVTRSFECKLYYATAGIGGTPTWVEVPGVQSVTLNATAKEGDVSIRALGGFVGTEPTLIDVSIEFNYPYVRGDAARVALVDAFFARTLLGIAVMDNGVATSGASGLWADMKVFSIPREESIDKNVEQKFTLKICYPSVTTGTFNAPTWKKVA